MPLYRAAYKSTVRQSLNKTEIRQVLKSSQDNNHRDNLTGALLFDSGVFLQVLEGSRAKLNNLFRRLGKDPRHKDIDFIGLEPIEKRLFPTWSMAHIESNSITKGILLKYCAVDRPDTDHMKMSEVVEMMLVMLGRANPSK